MLPFIEILFLKFKLLDFRHLKVNIDNLYNMNKGIIVDFVHQLKTDP